MTELSGRPGSAPGAPATRYLARRLISMAPTRLGVTGVGFASSGGTVMPEEVFTLPGVGRLVLWSIYQRDYPVTQSTILFIAAVFMTINLAVDVLYGLLEPRIRHGE